MHESGIDTGESFSIWIDPGEANAQEIADVMVAMSELYRAYGGPGFRFIGTNEAVVLDNGHVATEILVIEDA